MVSMRAEVMEFYGLTRSPRAVGYFETTHHRQLLQDIKQAVYDGDLVALCGVVGAGKTMTLRRLQDLLARESGNRGEVDLRREEPGHAGYTDHGAVL
jgi:type II secretory pathway predicted ATPase ExeA